MLSGAAKRKKKKNEEEQKKKQRGALQKFLSGSRPTAVNLLVSAEPEAKPGPEPGPETRPEDAVAPSTSASSFSTLKRVKTYRRATVTEKKLNAFALLAIENRFTTSLDFEDIIEDFASSKLRRKHL